jgi:hypothetical protein
MYCFGNLVMTKKQQQIQGLRYQMTLNDHGSVITVLTWMFLSKCQMVGVQFSGRV